MTARAADAAEMFTTSGIEAVMNAYNGGDPATTEPKGVREPTPSAR